MTDTTEPVAGSNGRPGSRVEARDPASRLLSGNQAAALGAIHAGVGFVAAFPGGPTTGLVDALAGLSADGSPRVQWSLNEKVAVEAAAGAAMGGVRSVAVMKHFGANNAADMIFAAPLMFIPGLVIIVGDDPHGHTSHSEQDTRPYPIAADMPCLEPASPQEAYEIMDQAFALSEELRVPVYLRLVKWLADWTAPVRSAAPARLAADPAWDTHHFQSRPIVGQHRALHTTLARVPAITAGWGIDRLEGPSTTAALGVVAAGNAHAFVVEALARAGVLDTVPIAKLGTINPLPAELLVPFLARCERVLVVEEIEPVVEDRLASLAFRAGLATRIGGRSTGEFPPVGQLTPELVVQAVNGALGRPAESAVPQAVVDMASALPERPAAPRPGNPHRPTFHALRSFARRQPRVVFMGDVGEAASIGRPFMKAHSAMGAGIGMAIGAASSDSTATVVTVVGDGTLYGFALSGIADAVYNRARLILLVVDNGTMESTGGQPTPTSHAGLRGVEERLDIEATLRGVGVRRIERITARDVAAVEAALDRAAVGPGVVAIIAEGRFDERPRIGGLRLDPERAAAYRGEIEEFGCPALGFVDGRARIEESLCVLCGDCIQVAPAAIDATPSPSATEADR